MVGRLIINIKAKNNLDYLFKQSPVSEPEGIEVWCKKNRILPFEIPFIKYPFPEK